MESKNSKIISIIILLTFVFITNSLAHNSEFEVINYKAFIEPILSSKSINGKVLIDLRSLKQNLTEIQLDAGGLIIDEVNQNNKKRKFTKIKQSLNIILNNPLRFNEKTKIEIAFHGTPNFGINFFPKENQIYTIFSTSQWMPCHDSPSDRATFELSLVLSEKLKTVGNGELIKEKKLPDGKYLSIWKQKIPVPTYLFGFAVGDFREFLIKHKGVKLRHLASSNFTESEVRKIFIDSSDMLDFFERKAGKKYPYKEYTQVLATGRAQQEMAGFTVINENYGRGVLENEKENWLAAHEFSHQWWGNMVTNANWNHFWLNEGMATFMVAAYKEHRFGREEYLNEIGKLRARYERVRNAGKDKSLVFPDWNNPSREDRSLVYNKGGYILHLLREEMGDAVFWKGIKHYTQKFWGKSVTTFDFQGAMEESSKSDLSDFFNRLVYHKTRQ